MRSLYVFLLIVLFPWPAYAYIDAGLGSLITQLALGGAAGALVVVKLYWRRIKAKFSGSEAESNEEPESR